MRGLCSDGREEVVYFFLLGRCIAVAGEIGFLTAVRGPCANRRWVILGRVGKLGLLHFWLVVVAELSFQRKLPRHAYVRRINEEMCYRESRN